MANHMWGSREAQKKKKKKEIEKKQVKIEKYLETVPSEYRNAMRKILNESDKLIIYRSDEAGESMWIIESDVEPGFWLDGDTKLNRSRKICERLGIPYEVMSI